MLSAWVKPIRSEPCVTIFDSAVGIGKDASADDRGCDGSGEGAVVVSGMSKSPLTSWRSGASDRRKWYTEGEVKLPRHRIWPILPGVRSFLNSATF